MMAFNTVNSVQCVYFSPTGGTKKIVETVAKGMEVPVKAPISITTPRERETFKGQIDGDLLIIGVPVYTGKYPSLIISPLSKLDGTGHLAIPIAVCGNVRMGTCLAELCGVLKRQNFSIPAAGNFIAQHSFICEDFPLGKDRPDKDDLIKAANFGSRIFGKIATGQKDITCRYRDKIYIRMYVSGSTEAKGFVSLGEPHRSVIRVSEHNNELCQECGHCVEACPTGAVDPKSFHIIDETCIRCFACTYVCPSGVKEKVVHPAELLASWFRHRITERGEPLLFY
jgi:ferredoxin